MTAPGLTDIIANWVAGLDRAALPDAVNADLRLRLFDTIGSALCATGTPIADAALLAAGKLDAGGAARVLGYGDRLSPAWAAMVNGTMAHAMDFDDTHPGASIHVSAPVVATALSLGDALDADLDAVLVAMAAGSEITARIGGAVPGAFQARGLHPTGIVGTLGAAVTAGKLLGLTASQLRDAVGIAASQASGISESFGDGTWPRRLHPGWAAHAGIAAATLAQAGFSGPAGALDGRFGLYRAFLGDVQPNYARITEGLGSDWFFTLAALKPYPCGHVTHGFVDAALALCRQGVRADEIEAITCYVSPWMLPLIAEPAALKLRPTTESGAKGSLQFTVATVLLRGGMDGHAYAEIADAATLALAARVTCLPDPDPPPNRRYKGWIRLRLADRTEREAIVADSLGSPANPMGVDDVRAKVRRIASPPLQVNALDALFDLLQDRGDVEVTAVMDLCCR